MFFETVHKIAGANDKMFRELMDTIAGAKDKMAGEGDTITGAQATMYGKRP